MCCSSLAVEPALNGERQPKKRFLVKGKVIQDVFGHADTNSGRFLGFLHTVRGFVYSLSALMAVITGFQKDVRFFVETRQSGSLKVRPYHNNRKSNQLRFFWKKESEREYTMVFLSQHEIENIQLF